MRGGSSAVRRSSFLLSPRALPKSAETLVLNKNELLRTGSSGARALVDT
jgi:hypothetical protein